MPGDIELISTSKTDNLAKLCSECENPETVSHDNVKQNKSDPESIPEIADKTCERQDLEPATYSEEIDDSSSSSDISIEKSNDSDECSSSSKILTKDPEELHHFNFIYGNADSNKCRVLSKIFGKHALILARKRYKADKVEGPRVKQVCRSAQTALGLPLAMFGEKRKAENLDQFSPKKSKEENDEEK